MTNIASMLRPVDRHPLDEGQMEYSEKQNALVIPSADGGVVVRFNPSSKDMGDEDNDNDDPDDHEANLAEFMDEGDLGMIAENLLEGIEEDDRSRQEWLRQRATGIKLLGFKIEEPRSDLGSSSAPLEGMSSIRHPLLSEACLRFQANASGELLPSDGPVKTENFDSEDASNDAMAQALEDVMNHYLTTVATEYYPDTYRLLFMTGFSGMAFKKIYYCPLRRRPVSEGVDAEHLIVSNTTTDLEGASRITHVVKMTQATFRRMQLLGVYREVPKTIEPQLEEDIYEKSVNRVQGTNRSSIRPEDQDHTLYECYAEVNLPGFEHEEDGEETGLPLPYKITIDKTSRQILEIRRDWDEEDESQRRQQTFVPFTFVPAFGFYGIGLLQILGNATTALTAAWRIALDSGMFGNFPGFLYAKSGARQFNNNIRVAPGSGAPVETPAGMSLRDTIMPLPYKPVDVGFMQLIENVASAGQRLGGTAELQVGEGKQEMPVGTTIALIEQASKLLDSVHKRLHFAQGIEFGILRRLFRRDPESLWRGSRVPSPQKQQLCIQALEQLNLVPRADPNIPSHIHRLAKGALLKQLQMGNPQIYDLKSVDRYVMQLARIDNPDQFFAPPMPPQAAPPDPKIMTAQLQHQDNVAENQTRLMDIQQRAAQATADRQSKERIEHIKLIERLAVHPTSQPVVNADMAQLQGNNT
jgi:hypothetical protein